MDLHIKLGAILASAGALMLSGCYLSHERLPDEATCPEEVDPLIVLEPHGSRDRVIRAGERSAAVHSYGVHNVSEANVEVAEWPQRFVALDGSLTTSGGEPVFTNIRLVEETRPTLLGPEAIPEDATDSVDVLLWDSLLLRARRSFTFTLVVDVADDAEGTFEITAGNGCHLTPRMWLVDFDGPETEMSVERIGNNRPFTTRVTITR